MNRILRINPSTGCNSGRESRHGGLFVGKFSRPKTGSQRWILPPSWGAFSGNKTLIRKMLAYGLDLNQRYGPDRITPVDVGEKGVKVLSTCDPWGADPVGNSAPKKSNLTDPFPGKIFFFHFGLSIRIHLPGIGHKFLKLSPKA